MKKGLLALLSVFLLSQCATVPITGRKQLKLVPSSQLTTLSFSQYDQFKKQQGILPDSDPRVKRVKEIGKRISNAVATYMTNNGMKGKLNEFQWEFNVTEDDVLNAWCMPGGKVMFYTGILPVCDTDDGIAVVMGHEIAHAVAKHGNERMSQGLALQLGGMGLGVAMRNKPQATQALALQAFGLSGQMGILKYSRMHESEADKMGLVFLTMAGYKPEAAISFWQRMAAKKQGQAPPEFLSTHPSDETRINDIKAYIPEARAIAAKY